MLGTPTTCPKCSGKTFKVQELEPQDSSFKLIVVQCRTCNSPIGVTDYYNAATLIHDQTTKLTGVDKKVDDIQRALRKLGQEVEKIGQVVKQVDQRMRR